MEVRLVRGPDFFRRRKSLPAGRARRAGALVVQAAQMRAGDFISSGIGDSTLLFPYSRQRRFTAGLLSDVLSFRLRVRRRRSPRPLEHRTEAGGKRVAAVERPPEASRQRLAAPVSSQNLLRSILPPVTTQTTLPEPALPLSPAATASAPAPSAITWLRSATRRMALAMSSMEQTMEPAST